MVLLKYAENNFTIANFATFEIACPLPCQCKKKRYGADEGVSEKNKVMVGGKLELGEAT